MRSKIHHMALAVVLLAGVVAAASAAAATPSAGEAQGKPDYDGPAQGPGAPVAGSFQCCQYLCGDKVSDYAYQFCTSGTCGDQIRSCRLVGQFPVDSCKECPQKLDRGQGDGHGKPGKEDEHGSEPGSGGTGGSGGAGGGAKKR